VDPSSARLILLPGLGVDARLFTPLRASFGRLEVPPWLSPGDGEPLADFAERMAGALDVAPGERFYLGGSSLGGMIALEMARHRPPAAVFLIGSCRTSEAIWRPFAGWPSLVRAMPVGLFRFAPQLARLLKGRLGPIGDRQWRLLVRMLADASPHFLRWGVGATLTWGGAPDVTAPVHHIHGQRDRLIPLRRVQPDEVVPGAGHVLALTRPDAVADFIARHIR